MRIYLDICSIQRPLDDQSQVRILDLCEVGRVTLLSSAAHLIETEQNPYPDRREHALNVLSLATHYVPTSQQVGERTQTYGTAGINRLDALHLALAVIGEATFFCTTDDRLLRRGREVDTNETLVVSPLELVTQLDRE